jgi:GNAT superfamily N-acetyltransferase
MEISSLEPHWVEDIGKIHYNSLPNDFLPTLGLNFLIKTFYPAVLSSELGKVFVAFNEVDEPVGFVLVTLGSNEFLKNIIKNRFWEFFKIFICSSFISLKNFKNNFQIIISGILSKNTSNFGEIYIIAVKKPFRGKGVGKLLVKKSMDFLIENELSGIKIKTLVSNIEWMEFFYKEGWKLEKNFHLIGKKYVSLFYKFDDIFPPV